MSAASSIGIVRRSSKDALKKVEFTEPAGPKPATPEPDLRHLARFGGGKRMYGCTRSYDPEKLREEMSIERVGR